MKKDRIPLLGFACWSCAAAALAGSTIDEAHPCAYGANIGWINMRGDVAHGADIGQSFCTGFVWSANCGWIGLGNSPANGWSYSNASAADWGVNHDGEGRLSGCAWGANIGWIIFEQTLGRPRIDLRTGIMAGHAWGANVGWIELAPSPSAYVKTSLSAGVDADGDGIPDAWEMRRAGSLTALDADGADADGDGVPDADEYPADTDPLDKNESLRIVSLSRTGPTNALAWTSRPTRLYALEAALSLRGDPDVFWEDAGGGLLGPPAGSPSEYLFVDSAATSRFYRVKAVVPLMESP